MLRLTDLLTLGDRHLHTASGAATIGHRRENNMILLVKAIVERRRLRNEFLLELVN